MALIRIERGHHYTDALRAYRVFVDSEPRGVIKQGTAIDLPVADGRHEVLLKSDWARSPMLVVDVDAEHSALLECKPNRLMPLGALAVLFTPSKYIALTHKFLS